MSDLSDRRETKHFTCGHKGRASVRTRTEILRFPLSLEFRPFPQQTEGAPERSDLVPSVLQFCSAAEYHFASQRSDTVVTLDLPPSLSSS